MINRLKRFWYCQIMSLIGKNMLFYIFSVLFINVFNYNFCFSQEIQMTEQVDKIIKSGKDSIINKALKLLDKDLEVKNFAKIEVLTNGKDVFVSFSNPIKYLPQNTALYFDAGIYLIEKLSFYYPVSNPDDYITGNTSFYRPTDEAEKNIQFVIDAINKSDKVGSFDRKVFKDELIIREQTHYFDVTVISEYIESLYKIDKSSGNIYDERHAHLIDTPLEVGDQVYKKVEF